MPTPVFTPEQVRAYAETRLFGHNVRPEEIEEIHQYNGFLPSEIETMLSAPSSDSCSRINQAPLQRVIQFNGREPIYYAAGALHIPQYSGFGRRRRYEEMILAYLAATDKKRDFFSHERNNDARKTNIFYENFAYDFVKKLFLEENMLNLLTVIIGPNTAMAKSPEVQIVAQRENEYLESQILNIGENTVLNIGYVYADQAGIIVDKMTREYEALARKKNATLDLKISMFGRVGGLHDNLQRQDLVFPTGIIDEIDLQRGRGKEYPVHNVFANLQRKYGLNFNVSTVINETMEQLKAAKEKGCLCVEMETRETVEAINRARRRYAGKLEIQFGFAGYVSDLPLQGDTLAEELTSDEGEQQAVSVIVEHIKER